MRAARAVTFGIALLAAGCSVILNTAEPTQCSTEADCDAVPSLQSRSCVEGFCVLPALKPGPPRADAGTTQACVSTELCKKANGGEGWHCNGHGAPCVQWQSARCPYIGGGDAWMSDDAIVIGAIQPFTGIQANGKALEIPYAERIRRAIDLAVDEIDEVQPQGIVVAGRPSSPLAVLHCNSSFATDKAQEVFRQLTDVVGVKAVIVGSDDDLVAVSQLAQQKNIAVVCSDCVGAQPLPPIAWRISPRLALQARMAEWRLRELEAKRKSEPDAPAQLKVALLTLPGRAPQQFVDEFVRGATFNGKSTADNGPSFWHVERSEDPRENNVNQTAHIDAIVAFEPDVIVVAMGDDFEAYYLTGIDDKWPSGKRRPQYILTQLNYDAARLAARLVGRDDLRRTLSGTGDALTMQREANINAFRARYRAAYPELDPSGSWSGYEAAYALAYAIAAAGATGTVDGPSISAGFGRLGSGPAIDVGKDQIHSAFGALAPSAGTINLRGLWSELDWAPATRDLDGDIGMWCVQSVGGVIDIKRDAGPRMSAATGVVTGTYQCD
jgi:ABC-type branched-subunit amino acid transport system substrate-binding protein